MTIRFIAQYGEPEDFYTKRAFSLAGINKMRYYIKSFKELGYNVKIYSTCATTSNFSIVKTHLSKIIETPITYRSSFYNRNPYIRFFDIVFGQLQLAIYLLFVKKSDIIVAYHERLYTPVVKKICNLRGLKYIIDVEEIYQIAASASGAKIEREINSLKGADAYFLASKDLADLLPKNTPYIVCNGNYYVPNLEKSHKSPKRILYSGTFDKVKGGVNIAIETVQFLPSDFTLVICGFGTPSEIKAVEEAIIKHNNTKGYAQIEYKGCLSGKAYEDVVRNCSIGLACQNPNHKLNNTSFPSKIFEYIKWGLTVISSKSKVVVDSECADLVTFFNDFTPKALADAIIKVSNIQDSTDMAIKKLIRLHSSFINRLKELINNLISL